MQRRVVITGLGIVSPLGNSYQEVVSNLRKGASGVKKIAEWEEVGLSSTVAGLVEGIEEKKKQSGIKKGKIRCMGGAALYCTLAAHDAIEDAALNDEDLHSQKTGCIVGSGIGAIYTVYQNSVKYFQEKINLIDPYTVVRVMTNSSSANIANVFGIKGRTYSLSSACATSSHNIGHAYELIRDGELDLALAGGGDEMNPVIASSFCAMRRVLSTNYNDTPESASRPYDVNRDGIVLSEGGGILILEELEHAQKRNAKIYAEITGFAANADGFDMVLPSPDGTQQSECMSTALRNANITPMQVDYLNTHGTSTPQGDIAEINAVRDVFEDNIPMLSSTKSMGGASDWRGGCA